MEPQYFAQINNENVVLQVAVVQEEFLEANPERYPGVWKETFIGVEGKTYAGIGFIYIAETENFIPPPPVIP